MTGKDIRRKIELAGVSYADVASFLGISPQALNSRLNGADLKLSFIQQVADAINKPIYYFFKEDPLSLHVQEDQTGYQIQYRRDDQSKKIGEMEKRIAEYEKRLKDKDETIFAQRKLIELYERQLKLSPQG